MIWGKVADLTHVRPWEAIAAECNPHWNKRGPGDKDGKERKGSWTSGDPKEPVIFFLFFGGSKYFHDVPGPFGIDFALLNAQNGGARSSLGQFWTSQPSVGPNSEHFSKK